MPKDDKAELATAVVVTMQSVLAPVKARMSQLEVEIQGWIRQVEALLADTKELGPIRERLAVLETRPPMPGPPGKDGEPGPPGPPGQDGKSFTFERAWDPNKTYDVGQYVNWQGSLWHCNGPTDRRPGDGSEAWTLAVKHGKDGRDGKDGGR